MDNALPTQKISGEIIIRCPKCKAVAAHETWDGNNHWRSYKQEFKLVFNKRWPFVHRVAKTHELTCPNGCKLEG